MYIHTLYLLIQCNAHIYIYICKLTGFSLVFISFFHNMYFRLIYKSIYTYIDKPVKSQNIPISKLLT